MIIKSYSFGLAGKTTCEFNFRLLLSVNTKSRESRYHQTSLTCLCRRRVGWPWTLDDEVEEEEEDTATEVSNYSEDYVIIE